MFLKQSPFEAWQGAQDHSSTFMQILLKTSSSLESCNLDLNMGINFEFHPINMELLMFQF
jgi:hypothetical protein